MSTADASTVDIERLRKVLGGEELRWVVERVRLRLEQGRPLAGSITLAEASADQRRAVDGLLGRAPRLGRSLTVPLADLDAVVRRSGLHPDGLGPAVVALTGPVVVRAQERAGLAGAWAAAVEPLRELVARRPELAAWYEAASARGLIKRACGTPAEAVPVVASATRLLGMLPLAGTPLAQVANEVAGDAHALDRGRPLATIVASAIRHTWWTATSETLSPSQRWRSIWDSVGIVTDELSTTALALNLPVRDTGSTLAQILRLARDDGEPVVLTLRQLSRHALAVEAGVVFVCENPAVVLAAANAYGPSCPPLVCASGQPTAAVLRLLSILADARCSLRYHGDFDWGGLRIANLLWSRYPLRPWRFDTASYLASVSPRAAALRGQPVAAVWDPDLGEAIARHGTRVEEEAVLSDLLADLGRHARATG
jgi:uncharacterized protein (TIGR02679 family)